jgi:glucose-1-phosphate thymidylyltransferase
MHAFILAGGFATRLWPLTERRAKPLLPVAGKPMLSWIVEQIPANIPVTVSTNAAFGDDMKKWSQTIGRRDLTVRIEETKSDDEKLGTLGATAQWIETKNIKDDILLLTGDNWFGFDMNTFVAQFDDMNTFVAQFDGVTLVAAHDIGDKTKASSFGTLVLAANGKDVIEFEEKPKEPKSALVSTGASILPRAVIPDLLAYATVKPDNVGGIFEELLRLERPVHCFRFTEPWFDIGSFESYLDATRNIVSDRLQQADTATVEECERIGSAVIGAGSTVKKSELEDTVIFENCVIEDCVLRDCIIDNGCVLKGIDLTGKMLRAGTTLVRK